MATIKTIRFVCPHCGKKAKGTFGMPQRHFQYYGCTVRTCKRCNRPYRDSRISEIGLSGKEDTYPRWDQFYLGWGIYYVFIGIMAVLLALELQRVSGLGLLYLAVLLLGSYVVQLIIGLLTFPWRKKRWQEEYDKSMKFLGREEMVTVPKTSKPFAALRATELHTKIILAVSLVAVVAAGAVSFGGNAYDKKMRAVLADGPESFRGHGNALVTYDEDSKKYTNKYIPQDLRTDDPTQVCAVVEISHNHTYVDSDRTPMIGFWIRDAVSGEILGDRGNVVGNKSSNPPDHEVEKLVAEKWKVISLDRQMRQALENGPKADIGKGNALVAYDVGKSYYSGIYIPEEFKTDDPVEVGGIVRFTYGRGEDIPYYNIKGSGIDFRSRVVTTIDTGDGVDSLVGYRQTIEIGIYNPVTGEPYNGATTVMEGDDPPNRELVATGRTEGIPGPLPDEGMVANWVNETWATLKGEG